MRNKQQEWKQLAALPLSLQIPQKETVRSARIQALPLLGVLNLRDFSRRTSKNVPPPKSAINALVAANFMINIHVIEASHKIHLLNPQSSLVIPANG